MKILLEWVISRFEQVEQGIYEFKDNRAKIFLPNE